MENYAPELALGILGIAGFELLKAWNDNAPKLQELRAAEPGDPVMTQRLHDAEVLVGGMGFILGAAFSAMTKKGLPLALMVMMFGGIVFWYHSVLHGEKVDN